MVKNRIIEFLRKTGRVLVSEVVGESIRKIQREVLAAQHISRVLRKSTFLGPLGRCGRVASSQSSTTCSSITGATSSSVAQVVDIGNGPSGEKTDARVFSVEDDAGWAQFVAGALHSEGLGQVASVIHAPLCDTDLALDGQSWYSAEVLTAAMTEIAGKIDLLVVDGPSVGAYQVPSCAVFRECCWHPNSP